METALAWIAAIFTVLAVLAPFIIYRLQARPKQFDYKVVTEGKLISDTHFTQTNALRILYGAQELRDPRILVVDLVNSGNTEIRKDDFEDPVRLLLPHGTTVVTSEVVSTSPEELSPSIALLKHDGVKLQPLLLNSGDWIRLQLLLDGPAQHLRVLGRIAGVKSIGDLNLKSKAKESRRRWMVTASAAAVSIALVSLGANSLLRPTPDFLRPPFPDRVNPRQTVCNGDAVSVERQQILGAKKQLLGVVELRKSSECNTVWGRLTIVPGATAYDQVSVKIVRPSDGVEDSFAFKGSLAIFTNMLNRTGCVWTQGTIELESGQRYIARTSCR